MEREQVAEDQDAVAESSGDERRAAEAEEIAREQAVAVKVAVAVRVAVALGVGLGVGVGVSQTGGSSPQTPSEQVESLVHATPSSQAPPSLMCVNTH